MACVDYVAAVSSWLLEQATGDGGTQLRSQWQDVPSAVQGKHAVDSKPRRRQVTCHCSLQITSWCGVCPAHLPEEQGPPWVLLAEPRQDEQGTACWARAPGAFAPSSVNCSMAGRASDCAAGGVGDDPVWGPVGGRYLRRSSSGNAGRRWAVIGQLRQ